MSILGFRPLFCLRCPRGNFDRNRLFKEQLGVSSNNIGVAKRARVCARTRNVRIRSSTPAVAGVEYLSDHRASAESSSWSHETNKQLLDTMRVSHCPDCLTLWERCAAGSHERRNKHPQQAVLRQRLLVSRPLQARCAVVFLLYAHVTREGVLELLFRETLRLTTHRVKRSYLRAADWSPSPFWGSGCGKGRQGPVVTFVDMAAW